MAISDGSTIACGQDDNMRETECHISGGKLSCGEGERMLCISKEWQPKSQHIKKQEHVNLRVSLDVYWLLKTMACTTLHSLDIETWVTWFLDSYTWLQFALDLIVVVTC